MIKTAKSWINILVLTISIWSIIEFFVSLFYGSIKIIGTKEFHASFFFLISMLCIAVIIAINHSWFCLKFKTKRNRLYDLHDQIVSIIDFLEVAKIGSYPLDQQQKIELADLRYKLLKLKIECPNLEHPKIEDPRKEDYNYHLWPSFLSILIIAIKNKDYKEAKNSMSVCNYIEYG